MYGPFECFVVILFRFSPVPETAYFDRFTLCWFTSFSTHWVKAQWESPVNWLNVEGDSMSTESMQSLFLIFLNFFKFTNILKLLIISRWLNLCRVSLHNDSVDGERDSTLNEILNITSKSRIKLKSLRSLSGLMNKKHNQKVSCKCIFKKKHFSRHGRLFFVHYGYKHKKKEQEDAMTNCFHQV